MCWCCSTWEMRTQVHPFSPQTTTLWIQICFRYQDERQWIQRTLRKASVSPWCWRDWRWGGCDLGWCCFSWLSASEETILVFRFRGLSLNFDGKKAGKLRSGASWSKVCLGNCDLEVAALFCPRRKRLSLSIVRCLFPTQDQIIQNPTMQVLYCFFLRCKLFFSGFVCNFCTFFPLNPSEMYQMSSWMAHFWARFLHFLSAGFSSRLCEVLFVRMNCRRARWFGQSPVT